MNKIQAEFKNKGVSESDLINDFGMKQPNANAIINGKRKVGPKTAKKLQEKYGVNPNILLFEYSERSEKTATLANTGQLNNKDSVTSIPYEDYMMVEYEDLSTAAGYLGINDLDMLPDTKKRLVPREFERGKYLVVRVDGHSMDDGTIKSIPDGTEILIREIDLDNGNKLPIRNNLFVVVSHDGVVLKQIIEHNTEEGYIKCHSYNPDFKDYKIPLSDVLQIFLYRKIVSFRPPIPDIEK